MLNGRSFKHDQYPLTTKHGRIAERIVLNYGEHLRTPPGELVISQTRARAICGAIEISLTDAYELTLAFVLSDGFDQRRCIRYRIPDTLLTDLDDVETRCLMDLRASHLVKSFDLPVDMGPVLHDTKDWNQARKRTTSTLTAQWLAKYLAFNYNITVEVRAEEGGTLAKSTADIAFSLPCYSGICMEYLDCDVEEGNATAGRAHFFVIT